MKIIDAHIHVWDLSNQINSWVSRSQDPNILQNISLNDYLDANQSLVIDGVVTIEAADSRHSLNEVKWLDKIRRQYSIKLKHIAYLDMLQDPIDFAANIDEYKHYNFVVGFRDIMSYSEQFDYSPCANDVTLSETNLDRLYLNLCCLAENNYLFNCQMYPEQLIRAFASIQKSLVKCVIDHAGLPTLDNFETWLSMLKLYKRTAAFKLSGLDLNGLQDNYQICEKILESIPISDIQYGSNFPVTVINKSQDILAYLKQVVETSSLHSILHTNAFKFYNFDNS